MPKVTRFPFFGKRFFRLARKQVGSCHFEHFWRLVTSLAGLQGRRSLSRLAEALGGRRSRQAISFFLSQADWDAPELLWEKALQTLNQLGYRSGDPLYLLLDDTQKRKHGKQMAAVSKIFLHAEKVYANGHTILGAALSYRNVVIPCAVRLWAASSCCDGTLEAEPGVPLEFRKLTYLAADLVSDTAAHVEGKVIALFDAYYLCPAMKDACQAAGYRYISVARKNRNFAPDGRPRDRRRLSRYGRNVLDREGRRITVQRKPYRVAERVGSLSKAGRVKLVFSRRPRETAWVTLVTNETRWSAKTILDHYSVRWGIELLFKMSKQYLGLGDYQMLEYRGVVRYLHLVLIAYLLLTHLGLTADAQACKKRMTPLRLPSILQLQQTLRSQLWDDAIRHLEKQKGTSVAARKIKELIHS